MDYFFSILQEFFIQYGYLAVFIALLICSIGVPIPEDVTLVTGGVIAGLGYANVHIMFIVGMAGVLIGDGIMFMAGKHYGDKVIKFRLIARVFTPARYKKMQEKFERYGNWVLFFARFMPGLRTAMFLSAGMSQKVTFARFLMMDGLAALISVPVWVYLGDIGARNIHWLKIMVHRFQVGTFVILGLVACFVIGMWLYKRKKAKQEEISEQ
ncbi:DedA family protein [Neisseria sp. Ec49-e6-T10]|uniref:DedA family protein n=1 Tax=Neisseria sp. Ec49-e6-T10 TaxID=3140744 RepID=UPI003EBB8864